MNLAEGVYHMKSTPRAFLAQPYSMRKERTDISVWVIRKSGGKIMSDFFFKCEKMTPGANR